MYVVVYIPDFVLILTWNCKATINQRKSCKWYYCNTHTQREREKDLAANLYLDGLNNCMKDCKHFIAVYHKSAVAYRCEITPPPFKLGAAVFNHPPRSLNIVGYQTRMPFWNQFVVVLIFHPHSFHRFTHNQTKANWVS